MPLTVRDDGRGFSASDVDDRRRDRHAGLSRLHEPAAGGRLTVESTAGNGTTVLEVPAG